MTDASPDRQPHATLDLPSRRLKGRKIERLLDLPDGGEMPRLLEVGAGSGGISHYFATGASRRYQVEAVDVVDNRQNAEGYGFRLIDGTDLPYPDTCMDVVISNHVIEHVGGEHEQSNHLAEIRRVMKRDGVGYLAVPNRWMVVEPHYRLAFLSWWPEGMRSGWLRLWRKGKHYDCRPLSRRQIERLLDQARLRYEQLHGEALVAILDIERPGTFAGFVMRRVPAAVWRRIRGIFPTLIYRVRRA